MLGGKKILALCTPRINDADCHKLITSINRNLPDDSWRLFVYATTTDLFWNNPNEKGEKAIFDLINYDITDVIIIHEERIKNKTVVKDIIDKAKAKGLPVISVGEGFGKAITVKFDYDSGFEKMVRHVIEEHHVTKPHFMAGVKDNEFSECRLQVFRRVIEENGIPFDASMVSYGDFWSEPAREAAEKLIAEGNLPEALICANDAMAISAASAFTSAGFRIPEDIIVTGFDGIDEIKFSIPRISSCMCSPTEMAKGICGMLDEILENGKRDGEYFISPSLILSESCGCNREESTNAADLLFDLSNRFYRYQEDEYKMYEMSAKILSCQNIVEVAQVMCKSGYFYDMTCVLKTECTDETIDPLRSSEGDNAYGETMIQVFDSDSHTVGDPIEFSLSKQLATIDRLLEYRIPMIFCGLHFLDNPLGYVCFHFHNDDIANYTKVPQSITALNNAIGSFRNMRYQKYMTWQIEEMYKLDNLTGLYNRNGFIREYRRIADLPESQRQTLTVIMTDLDGLKYINDIYGHDEGDNAIRTTAQALKSCCPEEALCVRFGGDEMLAVYNGVVDEEKLKSDIAAFLDEYNATSGRPYKVSTSVGIMQISSSDSIDLDELIKKSDKLMYFDKAKKKGIVSAESCPSLSNE